MVDQRRFDNQPKAEGGFLSAVEAARALGVQRRTLYAYVSRGLLRSAAGGGGRARRYARDDVERLAARHRARAGHGAVAASALRWGEPVLDSEITSLGADGPVYRGHAAVELARRGVGFERTAELLWTGELLDAAPRWRRARPAWTGLPRMIPDDAPPGAALPLLVATLGVRDRDRHDGHDGALLDRARGLIPILAAWSGAAPSLARVDAALTAPTVAAVLARALGARGAGAVAALDTALVLMADHELNASTFAARVAASTGADLHACLAAALATLSGPRHGAMAARVESLIDEVATPGQVAAVLRARLARGEELPGFGHPVYVASDPRCPPMLALARAVAPMRPRVRIALSLASAGPQLTGLPPTCDLGLVALSAALGLPRGSASAIFAVGRAAGWIAHILEQRAAGFLIRPRARRLTAAALS